jgi:dihydrofolate synthase/folylpolyglutamate synthase
MNYKQTLEWLFSQLPVFQRVGKSAYKADLDNTYALMELLGQPHKAFKSVHIAGTNGKGSTAHILASVYQEAGFKTGLYTSPHLRDFRERIRINGEMISEEEVVGFVASHRDGFLNIKPSFFEMTVGMAFSYFAQEEVDIAIIETGLGGRLDSTNIIRPELSVITNIAMDHMQFLGHSLEAIAGEKAGIIKNGVSVVIGEHQANTDHVFIEKAQAETAALIFAQDEYSAKWENDELLIYHHNECMMHLDFPLKGHYQLKNVVTAVCAARELGMSIESIQRGLQQVVVNTSFAGRWQQLSEQPLVICDTAHNYEGLQQVMSQLAEMNYQQLHFVLSVVDDKALNHILELFPRDARYYFCKVCH